MEGLGDIDAREINTVSLGEGIVLRVGRYGPYIEHLTADTAEGENPPRASVPDDIAPDELTLDVARDLLENQKDGDIELGSDPVSGHMIVAKSGRFGPYVTEIIPEPELDESMSAAAKKKRRPRYPSRARHHCSNLIR